MARGQPVGIVKKRAAVKIEFVGSRQGNPKNLLIGHTPQVAVLVSEHGQGSRVDVGDQLIFVHAADPVGRRVQDHLVAAGEQRQFLLGPVGTQNIPDSVLQDRPVDGFMDIVHGPGLERPVHQGLVIHGRDHENRRRILEGRVERLADGGTVGSGQGDIHDDQVVPGLHGHGHGFFAVGGLVDQISRTFQKLVHQQPDHLVIVNDQDTETGLAGQVQGHGDSRFGADFGAGRYSLFFLHVR